jgi:hypothetical protein
LSRYPEFRRGNGSLLQDQIEVVRILLQIDVPLSAKRQFQLFCSEHFPPLADILDGLAADQLWALPLYGIRQNLVQAGAF